MTCPFLTEVAMVICTACKVHKPIPSDRVSTASKCGENYRSCPLFLEALARTEQGAKEQELELDPARRNGPAAPKGEPP